MLSVLRSLSTAKNRYPPPAYRKPKRLSGTNEPRAPCKGMASGLADERVLSGHFVWDRMCSVGMNMMPCSREPVVKNTARTAQTVMIYGVNDFGTWQVPGQQPTGLSDGAIKGGWFSRLMDLIPIMRATSYVHHVWSTEHLNGACLGWSSCPSMMVPAFYISAMAQSSQYVPAYGLPGKVCDKRKDIAC